MCLAPLQYVHFAATRTGETCNRGRPFRKLAHGHIGITFVSRLRFGLPFHIVHHVCSRQNENCNDQYGDGGGDHKWLQVPSTPCPGEKVTPSYQELINTERCEIN